MELLFIEIVIFFVHNLRIFFAYFFLKLAIVAIETGNLSLAMDYLNKALEIDPDHRPSLLNSAVLIQEYGTTNHQLSAYQR